MEPNNRKSRLSIADNTDPRILISVEIDKGTLKECCREAIADKARLVDIFDRRNITYITRCPEYILDRALEALYKPQDNKYEGLDGG